MEYLRDLKARCGENHLPNRGSGRSVLYSLGITTLSMCSQNTGLNHVRYPDGWTVEDCSDSEAILIRREGGEEIARIVPTQGSLHEFTITIRTL